MHASLRSRARAASDGFTLLEVMITIVIVAILAAVAMPSFMDSIRKGRRSDATQALNAIQQAQERRRANAATYTNDITGAAPAGLAMSADSSGDYYALTASGASATAYRLEAAAKSGKSQAADGDCVVMVVQMTNGNITYLAGATAGGATAALGNKCWNRQ